MNLLNLRPLLRPILRSAPIVDGAVQAAGLRAPLAIKRDRNAVPHIYATNAEDAWFGLGFCQAQDRAFQLELRLRTLRGTLSQLVGEKTLAIDRLARRIGFVRSSDQLGVLHPDVRAQVEAFARGINAGLSAGMRRLPLEFRLLRCRPSPWTAADVIGMGRLFAFLLIGNWDVELARLKILQEDGPEALRDLDPVLTPVDTAEAGTSAGGNQAVEALLADMSRFVEFAGANGGSNAWAISGSRTASGRPNLANDPHLEPVLPAHWYLAHLTTPDWSVAGASLMGTPGFGAGHNGRFAWGVTAGLADTVDLFIEEVGADGGSVRRGDAFVACERRTEVIEVRGRSPVVEEVLETPSGPIVSPTLEGVGPALSLRALWLDARPARGFLQIHTARTIEALEAEFKDWPLFSQNLLYAGVDGQIGWRLVGNVPRRGQGNGTLPLPASGNGWLEGDVPFGEMPRAVDPPEGFLASANNHPAKVARQTGSEAQPFLGVDWLDEYRADRISEALAAKTGWDLQSSLRLQLDETDLTWRAGRGPMLDCTPQTDAGRRALHLLDAWDGVASVDSVPATIYQSLLTELWQRIARARAPGSAQWALGLGFTRLLGLTTFSGGRPGRILQHLKDQPEGWFARSWPAEIGDALDSVAQQLGERFGPDASGWAWGKVRPLTFQHPLSVVKLLAPLLDRGPYAWGGNGSTVSQAGTTPLRPLINPTVVASLRFVVEAGDWENARYVIPGGQSGDPFSEHYDDLMPLWLKGGGVEIAWSEESVARSTRSLLELRPLAEPWT